VLGRRRVRASSAGRWTGPKSSRAASCFATFASIQGVARGTGGRNAVRADPDSVSPPPAHHFSSLARCPANPNVQSPTPAAVIVIPPRAKSSATPVTGRVTPGPRARTGSGLLPTRVEELMARAGLSEVGGLAC